MEAEVLTLLDCSCFELEYFSSLINAIHCQLLFHSRSEGTTVLKYKIPTRGLLGLRNAILTASRGTAILNTIFDSYEPWAGDISTRDQGSLVRFWFYVAYLIS